MIGIVYHTDRDHHIQSNFHLMIMDREKLLKLLEKNEYDYHVLPHYGMVLDWFKVYWELHEAVLKYLDTDEDSQSTETSE